MVLLGRMGRRWSCCSWKVFRGVRGTHRLRFDAVWGGCASACMYFKRGMGDSIVFARRHTRTQVAPVAYWNCTLVRRDFSHPAPEPVCGDNWCRPDCSLLLSVEEVGAPDLR